MPSRLRRETTWTEPSPPGRLLYAVSEDGENPTLWYFDNGHTRVQYDRTAESVAEKYAGSEFVPRRPQ